MPLVTLNELEAVNNMLNLIGEMGVTDLSDTSFSFAHMARRLLTEESHSEQAVGFHWNTLVLELAPDIDGIIWTPDNTIKCRTTQYPLVVHRTNKLFNLETNSYIFTDPYECEVIQATPFDDTPYLFRQMINIQASRKFVLRARKDREMFGYTKEEEIKARSTFFSQDAHEDQHSLLDNQSSYDHLNKFGNPTRYRRY